MKGKKLTFNIVAAKMEQDDSVDTLTYNDITINVKKRLDMSHALQFTQDIVGICFNDEEAEYIPEVFDTAVRICTLMHYAGFDAPKDASKAYAVVYGTDIFDKVLDLIDREQFMRLVDGAHEKIRFKRDLLATTASQKVMELIGMMDDVVGKIAEAMKNMDTEKLTSSMNELSEKLNAKVSETSIPDKDKVIVMPRMTGDDA